MRVPIQARALLVGVSTLGLGVLAVSAAKASSAPLGTVALLAAVIIVAELFYVPGDAESFDAVDRHSFSFSSGVHLAAILIVGPWASALLAAFGVVCVDGLRGKPWRKVLFNACVFALATVGAGLMFVVAGGTPDAVELPRGLPAIAVLALTYLLVNTALVGSIVALSASIRLWPVVWGSLRGEIATAAAEAGLGVSIAVLARTEPWGIVALVPLALAVYQAHARLALMRRETARALETFANVVDERDPYTYRHSARVGESVHTLAEQLGLPSADVTMLSWAGRLHDLGKVAVDSAILRKPARLSESEWAEMRRHPRLSARLVRQFRFAAGQAEAIEFHHERFDGQGYYGIDARNISLPAHFLIVADTFDAMTTDRPYRPALSREQALAEIERQSGKQFHPAVAKAFIAVQRGIDPKEVLSPFELAELRRPLLQSRSSRLRRLRRMRFSPEALATVGLVGGLCALGGHLRGLALAGAAVAAVGLAATLIERARVHKLMLSLQANDSGESALDDLVSRLSPGSHVRWGGLVRWRENELEGRTVREIGDVLARPRDTALLSWLIREADARTELLIEAGPQLGADDGVYVAIPLRRDGDVIGFAVLAFSPWFPRYVELALRGCLDPLSDSLSLSLSETREAVPALRVVS